MAIDMLTRHQSWKQTLTIETTVRIYGLSKVNDRVWRLLAVLNVH